MDPIKPFHFDVDDTEIDVFLEGARGIMKSGNLILGEHTRAFEEAFAAYIGTAHAVSVSSGTAALEIMLRIRDVNERSVLVPTNTNFATPAAVLRAGGRVTYLDMDPATFAPTLAMVQDAVNADAETGDLAGLIWVHIGGVISPEFPAVVAFCHEQGLFVIEDAAHAHGSALGGTKAGKLADGGAFSFFPTKVMTTFEGGMITTDDANEAELARSFRNQGKRGVSFGGLHHDLGNSNRMSEISALLGTIQLAKLPDMLARRQRAYNAIASRLREAELSFVSTDHMDTASQYKLIVHLPEGAAVEEVKKALAAKGVILGGTVYELPCHRQPVFEGICPDGSYPHADTWCLRHICPPLTSGTTEEEAERVGEALVSYLTKAGQNSSGLKGIVTGGIRGLKNLVTAR